MPCFPALTAILLLAILSYAMPSRAALPPTDSIGTAIERVFSFASKENSRKRAFQADIYVKYELKTRRYGILMRYVPGMFPLERGINRYFGESQIKYTSHPGGGIDIKEVAFYSTMPRQRQTRERVFRRFNISIYSDNLFNDRILSPLNHRNKKFYKYEEVYCFSNDGENCCRMRVIPRFHNTQLVSGVIDVSLVTGRVLSFDFSMTYDMTFLRVKGKMGNEGLNRVYPENIDIHSKFTLLGNRIEASYKSVAKYNPIDSTAIAPTVSTERSLAEKYDITRLYTLKIDTAKSINSKAYFDSLRPQPLTSDEAMLYDFQQAKRNLQRMKSALPRRQPKVRKIFTPTVEDILLGSHNLDFGEMGGVKIPALVTPSMYQWSKSKGFYMQARFKANASFSPVSFASAVPKIGYNFKQRQFYWQLPATLCLYSPKSLTLHMEGGNGNRIYNSEQADQLRQKLQGVTNYDSIVKILNSTELHYYNDQYFKANISIQPIVGLKLDLGMSYHNRRLVDWRRLPDLNGLQKVFKSFAPKFHAEWTPALYYVKMGHESYPIRSRYPTFMLDYERGVPWGKCNSEYERWEMDIKYGINLHALRKISLRLGGGFYTNMHKSYFVDYGYFRDNNMPLNWEDEMSGQFQLLDSRFYNESKYYARFSASYESPMLVFSRVKFLSNYIQKERVYCNILNVHAFTPYVELGYGLATHIVDIGAFCSFAHGKEMEFGCKFALRLFEDW